MTLRLAAAATALPAVTESGPMNDCSCISIRSLPVRTYFLTSVGKTALVRAALEWIDDTTIVFETTAAQLNAGAVYIGELEGRVKTLVASVESQNVRSVWAWLGGNGSTPTRFRKCV